MNKQKKNLLVTLADENYIGQAKQLFSSVYWNAGWKGDYMLLAHEVPEEKLKWFRDKGILIKKCKPLHKKKVGFLKHSAVILDKFYLFTPKFKKWKNIIYLDADIIVRASLDKLIKINGFAATHMENRKLSKHFFNYKKIKMIKFIKLSESIKKNYDLNILTFNSGVMAFNSKVIKKETFNNLIKLLKTYNNIAWSAEETCLNLFFYKKWEKIPIVYNIFPEYLESRYSIKPEKIKGIILHFMGKNRPWHSKNYFYKEWKNNLKKSGSINFKKIQDTNKIWTKEQINKYTKVLNKLYKRYNQNKKRPIRKVFFLINKNIGKIGIFLKKKEPKLYSKLKKLKDKSYREK